ncbi:MAG: PQQ-binding-like beta-propeller repeat protein [Planctomycetota bacterium]
MFQPNTIDRARKLRIDQGQTFAKWLAVGFCFLIPLTSAHAQDAEPRHWTTADGVRSAVKLELIEQDGRTVKLKRMDNGGIVTMHLSKLSKEDRAYVIEHRESAGASGASPDSGTDWPQWRGPGRDGKSAEVGLAESWPSGGPELLWTATGLGQGFSTPSVVGDRVYVLGTSGDTEQLFALDANGGSQIWQTPLGAIANGGGYKGPRGAPTIDGDRAYAIGSDGTLVSAAVSDGSIAWKTNLKRNHAGSDGHWAYAESPLIDGDKLICTPGGVQATMMALRKTNGSVVWKGSAAQLGAEYAGAGYSSPVVATIAGTRQYITFIHGGVVSFSAAAGRPLWHYDSPANGTANCSTPVVDGDLVFAASGYGTGGGQARISGRGNNWSVNETYFESKFQNHHGGYVLVDGHLYGTNDSTLLCMEWRSGRIKWQNRSVGKGSICYADGNLYVRGEGGAVALVGATPDGYREKGRFDQGERSGQPAWPHPVVAGGKLYLHDWDRLFCYRLK